MIERKNVIRMYAEIPEVSSQLAVRAHMYICYDHLDSSYTFIKCQTNKPGYLGNVIQHGFVEKPDPSRNPFKNDTLVDCEKKFHSDHVKYDDAMITTGRSDVCDDVMTKIDENLPEKVTIIELDADRQVALNVRCSKVS